MTRATAGWMFTQRLLPATGMAIRSLTHRTSRSACG
nr:MAG TPA: hypothetical protein [Caudoviricetes sp.]